MNTSTDIAVKLSADTANFSEAFKRVWAEFKEGLKGVEASSDEAKAKLANAFSTLNVRSFAEIKAEADKIKAAFETLANSSGTSFTEVSRASIAAKEKLAALSDEMKGLSSNSGSAGSALEGLATKVTGIVAGLVSLGAAMKVITNITEAGSSFEQLHNRLVTVTGSADGATRAFEFIQKTAADLALPINTVADSFAKLAASTMGTALEGERTNQVFLGISKAVAGMHLPVEQANGVFTSLIQMMSKGRVQAEELTGQLSEHLPGALKIAADGMGVSTAELLKMVSAGEVLSADFLPKFAAQLESTWGGAALNNATTYQGKLNEISNSFTLLYQKIANSGFLDALKASLDGVVATASKMAEDGSLEKFARNAGEALGQLVTAFSTLTKFAIEHKDALASMAGLMVANKVVEYAGALKLAAEAAKVAGGAVENMNLAMKANLVILAGMTGWEIGSWLNRNIVEPMISGKAAIDPTTQSVKALTESVENISKMQPTTNISALGNDLRTVFESSAKAIQESSKLALQSIIADEKKAEEAYQATAATRVAASATAHQKVLQQNIATETRLKELEKQKTTENLAFEKERTTNQEAALGERESKQQASIDKTHAAETLLKDKLATLESEKTTISSITYDKREKAQDKALNNILGKEKELNSKLAALQTNQGSDSVTASFKARELAHKTMVDNITAQEAKLKADQEAAKQAALASDRAYVQSSLKISQDRLKALNETNELILAGAKVTASDLAKVQLAAQRQELRLLEVGAAERTHSYASAAAAKVIAINADYEQQIAASNTAFGKLKTALMGEVDYHKEQGEKIATAMKAAADKAIGVKENLVTQLTASMKKLEGEIATHTSNITSLENKLAASFKTLQDNKFDISLIGTSDAEKLDLYRNKVDSIASRMVTLNAEIEASGGKASKEQAKELDELRKEMDQYGKSIAQMGKDTADSVYTTQQSKAEGNKIVEQSARLAETAVRAQIAAEQQQMEANKTSLEEYKNKLVEVQDEVAKLKDLKVEISADGTDIEKLKDSLEYFDDLASKGVDLSVKTDEAITAIAEVQEKAVTPAEKTLTVKPDTLAAEQAIARLTADAYKTIYVRTVQENSNGGYISHLADGGFPRAYGAVTGPGTETSDSIPAMLSDGEFVMRAAAVKKFGKNFMYSLNNGIFPQISGFAVGGLAGSTTTQKNDVVDINLNIGGRTYQVQSAREQALGLASAFREISRAR